MTHQKYADLNARNVCDGYMMNFRSGKVKELGLRILPQCWVVIRTTDVLHCS